MVHRFPTAASRAHPPAAWCNRCRESMPQTPRQNCTDCEADHEARRLSRAPESLKAPPPPASRPRPQPFPFLSCEARAALTATQRQCYDLVVVAGRSVRKAAKLLQVSPQAVSRAMQRVVRLTLSPAPAGHVQSRGHRARQAARGVGAAADLPGAQREHDHDRSAVGLRTG